MRGHMPGDPVIGDRHHSAADPVFSGTYLGVVSSGYDRFYQVLVVGHPDDYYIDHIWRYKHISEIIWGKHE